MSNEVVETLTLNAKFLTTIFPFTTSVKPLEDVKPLKIVSFVGYITIEFTLELSQDIELILFSTGI